jgi:hypothetical protein
MLVLLRVRFHGPCFSTLWQMRASVLEQQQLQQKLEDESRRKELLAVELQEVQQQVQQVRTAVQQEAAVQVQQALADREAGAAEARRQSEAAEKHRRLAEASAAANQQQVHELQRQVRVVTDGYGYEMHQRLQKDKAAAIATELEDECDVCFATDGKHEPGCPGSVRGERAVDFE